MKKKWILFIILFGLGTAHAKKLCTNAVCIQNAPAWLETLDVEQITQEVEDFLEWSIHKVQVRWFFDQKAFQKAHHLGPQAIAVTRKRTGTIFLGPQVTRKNFARVFAHELTHVVLAQKYKRAIPIWLEEGLANWVSGKRIHNWKPFSVKKLPPDVTQLGHPFQRKFGFSVRMQYQFSTALIQMLSEKCNLSDLISLSVGKKMETYIRITCEIKDLNLAFRTWIFQKTHLVKTKKQIQKSSVKRQAKEKPKKDKKKAQKRHSKNVKRN